MWERIRDCREEKGLTQKTLAMHLNVCQSTYSDYELGNLNIPLQSLIKLADFFETSIDYLLERTDDPRPYARRRRLL